MRQFIATATSDLGYIYTDEKIKAGKWSTAFNRAGHLAEARSRRRPKRISISMSLVGTIKKPKDVSYLGLPADETTPEPVL